MIHESPFDQPLPSLTSHGILSKEPCSLPELKASRGSYATVGSSDIKVRNGLSAAACNDVDHPWGHKVTPIMLEPAFINVLDQLLHRFNNQLIPSNDDHHRAHGGHSHKTGSRKPEERDRKGQSSGQDAGPPGPGGGGKKGKSKGIDGESPPDGYRYPLSGTGQLTKFFGCPFYITDPVRFHECSSHRLRRHTDVSQHIERCHLLKQVTLETTHSEAAGESHSGKETCTKPNLIKIYDSNCRQEFHGPTAEDKFKRHGAGKRCDWKTIEDTGMLLPQEYKSLIEERKRETEGLVAKWYAMWRVCFPCTGLRIVPVSPYVQTIVPRERADQIVREGLQQVLNPMENHNLIANRIVNGLYPIEYATDSEVLRAVQYQQGQEDALALSAFNTSNFFPWGATI
ncbi:hypothetical protein FOYG_00277 [Fusarium oxysporum NRRL 32931]|uniref:Uncharacterized protein n=1 Tax=Fusarium oxysporum NRRL 32931 TaxID=660029 RepID=W9J6Q2_FUSOX|nr:hypothetical protein FOYG_00277 [Fusarium oxysporum NRRL 32931]